MSKGRYEAKKKNNSLVIILVILLTIILLSVVAIMVLLIQRGKDIETPTEPETSMAETTLPETEPPTQAPTEAPTEPPTEEPTDEPTEEPTEETTEPPTEAPTEATAAPATPEQVTLGEAVAQTATDALGKLFELGGSGPETFDTSGLVYYCFQENDVSVPRSFSSQAEYGQLVGEDDLLPGDVLFFWTDTPGQAQYVGIYIGDGKFVAARNESNPVSEMDLEGNYFSQRFLFARRYSE